jgi:hypothetical protein
MATHVFRRNKQFTIYTEDYQYAFLSFAPSKEGENPLQQIRRKIPTLGSVTTVKRKRTIEESWT